MCTDYYSSSDGEGTHVLMRWTTASGTTESTGEITDSMNVGTKITVSMDVSSLTSTYTSMYFKIRTNTDDGTKYWTGYVYKIWLAV